MDIEKVKNSIIVLVAKNEQSNMHITSRFQLKKINWMPYTLHFCDYTFTIPKNEQLGILEDISFENICAIERKASLTELSGNFCRGRLRFETEFIKAINEGCKATLLIEDINGKSKMVLRREMDKSKNIGQDVKWRKTWRSDFTANSMIASIAAFKERYALDIVFCKKIKTVEIMMDIFYKSIDDYFAERVSL